LPDTLDPQYWPNTEARAHAIGKAIACYDIVVLNETTNVDRIDQIHQAMEEKAPNCPDKQDRTPGAGYFEIIHGPDIGRNLGDILAEREKNIIANFVYLVTHYAIVRDVFARTVDETPREPVTDDSVTIISRLPILETNSIVYRNRSGSDSYGAKGVLHARLAGGGPSGGPIDVFATHLQASGGSEVRQGQIKELAAFVEQHNDPQTPALLLGDLNTAGPYTRTFFSEGIPVTTVAAPHANYQDIRTMLVQNLGFIDIGLGLSEGTNIVRADSQHQTDHPAQTECQDNRTTLDVDESNASYCNRIDYILVAPRNTGFFVQSIRVEKFDHTDWQDMPTLSDHAGVSARLLFQGVQDPE
jgi:endonuclease/exonuclease/phosphatase family metal-dependent hydrolase